LIVSSNICSGSFPAVSTNKTVVKNNNIEPALQEYLQHKNIHIHKNLREK
jgi:hypothetical protein